jgi:phasin family protein
MSPQADLFDLYRTSLKSAADLMRTSLEGAERLQNQQLVAVRRALDQQVESMRELGEAKSLDQLLAAQTRMAGAQFERAMTLVGELCEVAAHNQREAITCMQDQLVQVRTWLSDGYAVTARATEEAAKFAVTAQAALREATGARGKSAA